MPRYSASFTVAAAVLSVACHRPPVDNAKPVASATVSVNPAVVASGKPIELDVKFAVAPDAPPFQEDYTVFVHVVDDDGRMIGAADHSPPTPTREWKAGTTVEYKHEDFAPVSDYVGGATFVVGLYSKSTGERLPMAGEVVEPRAVKAGSFEIRERSDPYAVTYGEGWHPLEAPSGSGVEWRWSSKSSRLIFANPKRDVDLIIELDQPIQVFPIPQHVEIRLGNTTVDDFDVEPGAPVVRTIALSEHELGDGENVDLVLVPDKTFVPAKLPALQTTADTRQLGVRVFRAFVQPKE
jgi:hypothetical protein